MDGRGTTGNREQGQSAEAGDQGVFRSDRKEARPPQKGNGLLISRLIGESIEVDGPAKITVVEVRSGERRCRLQIQAPPTTVIVRSEIARKEV